MNTMITRESLHSAFQLVAQLDNRGLALVPVPETEAILKGAKGEIILRVIPTAAHTLDDVNYTIAAFKSVRDKLEGGIKRVTFGVTPATPNFKAMRVTGSSLNAGPTTVVSDELRADRQVPDLVLVGLHAGAEGPGGRGWQHGPDQRQPRVPEGPQRAAGAGHVQDPGSHRPG